MSRAIDVEKAVEIIEAKQKELCPTGKYGRNYVYGSDREKYDAWEEIIDALENLPTLTPQNEWVSVEERLPELPDASWCSRSIIVCDKDSNVASLLWARAQVRGKTVERWKYHWGRIYDGPEITHWMPLPAPPETET